MPRTSRSNPAVGLIGNLVATCFLLASIASVAAPETPRILVLYSNSRLLPANIEAEGGLRETLAGAVDLSAEFLDYPRFSGEPYIRTLTDFLREKYAVRPPVAIVVGGKNALAFLLEHREGLFPKVPVIHMGVPRSFLGSIPALPADVVGVPFELDFAGTIDQALRWHPHARRLVLVTGSSDPDRGFEARLRTEVPRFRDRAAPEFLVGLPTAEVLQRLGELGEDAIVFTPGYFRDGAGRDFTPREAAAAMAAAAGAPVYGAFDPFIGTGIVGGSMTSFKDMGRQAGETVNALLAGTPPAALRLPPVMPTAWHLDWRQVRRWGIDQHAIPSDAVVSFRSPTFFEAHRKESLAAAALFLLQTGLIAWLLMERRRRRLAELTVQKHRYELAHASRLAVAGELTGSIAHEINQPLGAILSNADAAELILESGPRSERDRREDLRAILADIRRDNLRASSVIQRLRSLLAKQEVEQQRFDLNDAMGDAAAVLRAEARRRRVTLDVRPAAGPALMVGDPVQIQQVLIILVLNAMDAMADLPDDRCRVMMSLESRADVHAIAVRDCGTGIAPEQLPRLFDSFFSTKRKGMGLGLSIARSLVEAHRGRIWAENAPVQGAIFHVELPGGGCRVDSAPMSAGPLIHVVDDDESLRTALLRLLDAAGFEARGYASSGDFLMEPPPDRPGCLLLDVRMPGPSGLELQAALRRQGIGLPVVFLTAHADVASSVRAMKAGAVDFLTKPITSKALLEALRRALNLDAAERAARGEAERLRARFQSLTVRERDVFDRVVAGRLNKQIADELGICERTVKMERARVMAKLGVGSTVELGSLAERLCQLQD